MEDPEIELDLTNSQFELLVAVMNSVRTQKLSNRDGEVELSGLVGLRWDSSGVHFEMKANHE